MDKKTGKRVALKISTEDHNGWFHVHARAYVISACQTAIDIPEYESATIGGLYLTGLTVTCHGHSARHGNDPGRLYGFAYGYQVSGDLVSSREAPKIAKALATIDRRLEKLYSERGAAESFPEYVLRIAEAIGADEFVERRKDADCYPWKSAEGYRRLSLSDGRYHMTRLISEWQARVNPAPVSQAS